MRGRLDGEALPTPPNETELIEVMPLQHTWFHVGIVAHHWQWLRPEQGLRYRGEPLPVADAPAEPHR